MFSKVYWASNTSRDWPASQGIALPYNFHTVVGAGAPAVHHTVFPRYGIKLRAAVRSEKIYSGEDVHRWAAEVCPITFNFQSWFVSRLPL
jgi:hypothetical protein